MFNYNQSWTRSTQWLANLSQNLSGITDWAANIERDMTQVKANYWHSSCKVDHVWPCSSTSFMFYISCYIGDTGMLSPIPIPMSYLIVKQLPWQTAALLSPFISSCEVMTCRSKCHIDSFNERTLSTNTYLLYQLPCLHLVILKIKEVNVLNVYLNSNFNENQPLRNICIHFILLIPRLLCNQWILFKQIIATLHLVVCHMKPKPLH